MARNSNAKVYTVHAEGGRWWSGRLDLQAGDDKDLPSRMTPVKDAGQCKKHSRTQTRASPFPLSLTKRITLKAFMSKYSAICQGLETQVEENDENVVALPPPQCYTKKLTMIIYSPSSIVRP